MQKEMPEYFKYIQDIFKKQKNKYKNFEIKEKKEDNFFKQVKEIMTKKNKSKNKKSF